MIQIIWKLCQCECENPMTNSGRLSKETHIATVVFLAIAAFTFIYAGVAFYGHMAERRAEAARLVEEFRVGRAMDDVPRDLFERMRPCGPESTPYAAAKGIVAGPGTTLLSYCRFVSCAYIVVDGTRTTGTIVQVVHYIT